MSMTAQQKAAIKEAARATYREQFAPPDAAQMAVIGEVIAPVWRQICRERQDAPQRESAAMPPGEAA